MTNSCIDAPTTERWLSTVFRADDTAQGHCRRDRIANRSNGGASKREDVNPIPRIFCARCVPV